MSHRYERRGKRSPEASITTGAIFTLAFGLGWYFTGTWWFVFPMVFAGILPLVEGLRRLGRERQLRVDGTQREALRSTASAEKQILLTAKEEKGIVTPALVALKTDLSIQEAEKLLEEMARKGYAAMRVTESGRIEYEFPEFLPRLGGGE